MKKIPKYKSIRILLVSGIFYFFLVMPFMGVIFIQKIPDFVDHGFINLQQNADSTLSLDLRQNSTTIKRDSLSDTDTNTIISNQKQYTQALDSITNDSLINKTSSDDIIISNNPSEKGNTGYFSKSFDIFFTGFVILIIISLFLSYPFKKYFRQKRKGKEVSTRLEFFCRRYLLITPTIYTALFGLLMLITVGYIGYVRLFGDLSVSVNAEIFDEYFYIAALSGFLSTIFVFYWHKHRVHLFYLEVLFQEDELRKRIFRNNLGNIRNRLWLASGMTTLLPLGIVIFYLALSISKVSELNIDTTTELARAIILGDYQMIFSDTRDISDFLYVNAVNAAMMFIGIGTSIFISLIYIFTFVRWTTEDIVSPVKELLSNMQKTDKGETTHFSIVRTNDEIGELAEGYNMMSQRIKNYIDNINEINQSYYRFIPKQFLEFLDKKSFTDIHLGNQVQKEMTVMFSDIRSFTEISERMSPRETFNFINHYLGYMEPVISRNKGFIDKYIGDAIMALFPETVDDAIDAAIEMRIKLQEFNDDLILNGKEPINSGIGINTGKLMLGIVGGKGRLEGTVISDHVNLASRIEGLTKKYGASIIITQNSLIKLKHPENYHYRFLDEVKVKGKKNSVNIFEILDGETPKIREIKLASREDFRKGVQLYRNAKFAEALDVFKTIQNNSPNDKAITLYIDRCQNMISNGIPDQWDGAESWDTK